MAAVGPRCVFVAPLALTSEALLEVTARVRRALRMIGITDVSIDMEADGASGEMTSR